MAQVADFGTDLVMVVTNERDAVVSLVGATSTKLLLRKPSGAVVEKDVEFVNNGSDGKVRYVVEDGVLDEPGEWEAQVRVRFGDSGQWSTKKFTFMVGENVD